MVITEPDNFSFVVQGRNTSSPLVLIGRCVAYFFLGKIRELQQSKMADSPTGTQLSGLVRQ